MIEEIGSNVVGSGLQGTAHLCSLEHFGVESDTLLGVLKDCWDLDGTAPVGVVEALAVDQFL